MNHFTKKIAYLIFFACIAKLSFSQYIGGSGSGFSNSNQSTIVCDKPSQFYPYNGGISSGHSVSTYTLTNCSTPPQFFAYTGGSGSGSSVHSPPTITCSNPSQFFAYNGGSGDGFANDATTPITCSTPNQFYAYYGGSGDGFARDTFTNCPTQPPVTNFTASSQTVCAGSTVNFTDLSTRNPSSWSWSFQGGTPTTSNLQNPSITYNTPGTYSVSLTATNLMGSNTYSVASYITVVALPAANAGSDVSICSATSTTLTATGGTTYSWTPVNSLSNPSIANPVASPTTTTVYTVTMSNGTCTSLDTVKVTVIPIPTINATNDLALCYGSSTTLNATGGNAYSWSPSTGLSSTTTATTTANPTVTTTYTVTGSNGVCTSKDSVTVTINSLPTASVTANGATTFCQGNSVTLSANTGTGLTYQWKNNGNSIFGATTSTLSATSSGSYAVVVTNNNNCSATSNAISVIVNQNVTPSFTQVPSICVGGNLSALPTTSNNNITGNWAPALNNTATTTYTFTPTSGQCAVNTQMTITVNPGTTPTFNQISPICVGDNLNALPTTSTNNISGSWSPTVNNSATTTYTFTPNAGQCAVTTQMTINVTSGTTPSFSQVGPFCSGDNLLPLPITSSNGISGSWSPALNSINNTTYTFTPNAGQCASPTTMSITIHPRPSATISAGSATTFCQGGSVTLNANSGSGLTYQWSTNGTTPSINVTASGNYFVNVTNSFNCSSASNSINVTVHPIGFAQINSSSSTTFCQGDSVILQANLGASYLWSTGATTQSIVAYNPGIYHVSVGDINNCATTTPIDSVEIIVNPNPATPIITSNRSTALCIGDTVILTSTLADSYLWNTNSTGNSIAVTTQGNYFVNVYNQFGCSATSAPTSVTVNDPLVDFTADTLLVFIPAANVNFTAITNGVPAYTYNWSFGNGNTSASSSPTTTYFNIGFYDVTLSLTDNTGCTKTITKPNYIQVEQLFPSYPAITNTTEDITSMAYNDPTTGIMTLMNGNCILSTDSGNTWNPVSTGNTEPLFCSYTVPGKWFVGGANGTILQSIDNGLNWNTMNSGTQQFIKGCGFTSSPVRGYAVGTNGLINYFDGINWNIQTSLTSNDLNGVYVFEDGRAYVAGDQSTLLYYNGSSWINQTSPLNFDVKEIRFANQNLGYAVGRNGIILKTTDAGNNWDPSLTGVDVDFNSVEAIGQDSAWATGTGGIVYTTINAGLTWTRYSVGDTDNQSSLRVKGGKGHIGGNSGNARNFSSGNSSQTVSLNSIDFSSVITTFKLYPVPANNKVEVSGKIDKTNKLIIQVKDVLGKTIDEKTYLNIDGKAHFILNTSDYLSGVYFLHIQQDNKSWVQKFIIEK